VLDRSAAVESKYGNTQITNVSLIWRFDRYKIAHDRKIGRTGKTTEMTMVGDDVQGQNVLKAKHQSAERPDIEYNNHSQCDFLRQKKNFSGQKFREGKCFWYN